MAGFLAPMSLKYLLTPVTLPVQDLKKFTVIQNKWNYLSAKFRDFWLKRKLLRIVALFLV